MATSIVRVTVITALRWIHLESLYVSPCVRRCRPAGGQDKVGADPTGLPFNSVIALDCMAANRFRHW